VLLGFVLIALLFRVQSPTLLPSEQGVDLSSQQQTVAHDTLRPANEEAKPQAPSPALPQTPKDEAWQTLQTACDGNKVSERASATLVLGLLRNDAKARKLAEKSLADPKPEVRSAAAAALGEIGARRSIPKLRKALGDEDPSVALAAAHALHVMHDNTSYEVYYEVLTRQRKSSRGLISSHVSNLSDPKKMAQLGFEEGIGFIPFAGMGWRAVKDLEKVIRPLFELRLLGSWQRTRIQPRRKCWPTKRVTKAG